MTTLNSGPASLKQPSEMITLANAMKDRRHNQLEEEAKSKTDLLLCAMFPAASSSIPTTRHNFISTKKTETRGFTPDVPRLPQASAVEVKSTDIEDRACLNLARN